MPINRAEELALNLIREHSPIVHHEEDDETVALNEFEELMSSYEMAADLLIEMAGFDGDDSDSLGVAMGETVKDLMVVLFMRCPQLAERISGTADDDVVIEALTHY